MAKSTFKSQLMGNGGVYSYGAPVRTETSVWGKNAKCYFVDTTNGSDSAKGTSWAEAVATPGQAYTLITAQVSSGTPAYVYIAPGSYTISSAIAVVLPYIYWVGAGSQIFGGGGLTTFAVAADTGAFTLSAVADGGGIFGITFTETPTTTTNLVITTGACDGYSFVNNSVVSAAPTVTAFTAFTGTGSYEYIAGNRFVGCGIGVSSAGAYSTIAYNIFMSTGHTATTYGIKKLSGSSNGEVNDNMFRYISADGHVVGISIASGADTNLIYDNRFDTALTNDPISDGGANTWLQGNRNANPSTSFDFTSATGNASTMLGVIIT